MSINCTKVNFFIENSRSTFTGIYKIPQTIKEHESFRLGKYHSSELLERGIYKVKIFLWLPMSSHSKDKLPSVILHIGIRIYNFKNYTEHKNHTILIFDGIIKSRENDRLRIVNNETPKYEFTDKFNHFTESDDEYDRQPDSP